MEILLSIPESLKRYVEYIPEDILPEVLIGLLHRGVFKPDVVNRIGVSLDDALVSRLLTAIKDSSTVQPTALRSDDKSADAAPTMELSDKISPPVRKVITPMLDGDDDLDDFLGLLK